jgi:hypothetical protein
VGRTRVAGVATRRWSRWSAICVRCLGHSSLRQQWFYDDKGAVSVGQTFGMNRLEDELVKCLATS